MDLLREYSNTFGKSFWPYDDQSSHPLRKSDFWSEFGHFGEMAPKWLRNSDTLTIGAIVIDYINTFRVFQHKQDEY